MFDAAAPWRQLFLRRSVSRRTARSLGVMI
jgi:hypothetical protein